MDPRGRGSSAESLGVALVAVAVLFFAKPVLLPLAVALLLNVVLGPAVLRLERLGAGRVRIGRVGAVLVVALLVAGAFAGIGAILAVEGGALVDELPEYRRHALAQLREPLDSLKRLERTARAVRELTDPALVGPPPPKVEVVEGGSELLGFARDWAGSVASLLATAGLVLVLLAFLLIEREALRDRVIRVVAHGDHHLTTSALADAVDRTTRYLRALALLNAAHGALVALGLWAMGVPGAPLLGLLTALLRFVPYLGPWLAASLALVVALASSSGWATPLAVALFFVALELVSNNLLEPWLFGTTLGLSPFALILSTLFWAWLWGPLGIVLATPLTACLVALGRHAPGLEPITILLGDGEALPPSERLYQRLLARDAYEATALVGERIVTLGAITAWDEVVVPALVMLERDRSDDRLDAEQLELARETFETLLAELPEPAREAQLPAVLCVPARDGWDETVCAALVRFLADLGVPARTLGHKLSAELADELARCGAPLACISSLSSAAGAARHLALRIRRRCPDSTIVLGLWGQRGEPGAHADPRIIPVTRLAEARDRLRSATPA